jgi:cell division protein FtsW (lipid II flippase)
MAARLITRACIAVFVCGVVGLIIASVAGNNNGVVLSIGGAIALAAIVLMAVNTVTVTERIDAFLDAQDETAAEQLETRVSRLVAQGADESDVRALIRDAWRVRRR